MFRYTQMMERVIRLKNYFEFRNIVRNTAAAGIDDVLAEFVDMCKIYFVHWHDVGSR